ncbi:hypothetical protein [Candidatus Rhabdochlamydia sp. T3358]|uniref:hypothetical protein n=1 Tax=Candidatus Rhabdochlamydia sp. T3358 TaxID=2099795 RepID=UPI0010B8A18A|nr:hypothetical protein [Candidatus Rhabdochlamydia sp. T3358]VHO00979.1 hypothetical protein RHT_00262 [Candidatus Rhabdochlamydia sp. T3358]
MSLPIGSGSSQPRSSQELYLTAAEALDSPSTSHVVCRRSSEQASTIARCNSSDNLIEQDAAVKPPAFLAWQPSPGSIASYVADLFEAGGVNHNLSPAKAREFVDAMRAFQKPTENKIARNTQEGTSKIEFRPKHSLSDIHDLGLFLEKKGRFAGCNGSVEQKAIINGKEISYSAINIINYQDLVGKKYQLLWENRAPKNSEEYKIPKGRYSASRIWPERKKTSDQLEKQLSNQKRLLQRAVEKMHVDGKPFDPAFTRIYMLTDKEDRVNKLALSNTAEINGIFFEYRTKIVPLEQEVACIAEIDNSPTYTIQYICNAIEADLNDNPIEIVDLHKISHLLEQLGGFASSSACVEREYTIGGKECHCTAIILRNRQDLVNERYFQLWDTYGLQHDLSQIPPKCDYPVSLFQKKKTPKEADEQLIYQKELLQKAVEKMYIEGVPFDPLFARVYIPTDQERIDNGASIFNIAQTDTILFVYAKSENKDVPLHAVDQICEAIKTMAADKFPAINTAETSAIDTTLKVAGRVAGFFLLPQGRY